MARSRVKMSVRFMFRVRDKVISGIETRPRVRSWVMIRIGLELWQG